jgi:hypothetical protein
MEDKRATAGHKSKPFISEFRDPAPTCVVLDQPTITQIKRLEVILKHHSRADLEHWAKNGIQTIPLVLAAAFAQLGVEWAPATKSRKT